MKIDKLFKNLKIMISSLFIFVWLLNVIFCDDNLKINFLPSEKYKLNKKDLNILKQDLERQITQRVFEIQSSWDERRKLRHYAVSKPPIIPPYQIPTPPVNIPINGNAFAANLNFDNPEYDSKLFDPDKDAEAEDKIANYVEAKIQKDLSTQIALTRQAIEQLNAQIDIKKKATLVDLNNNLGNPKLETDGTKASDVNLSFLQKEKETDIKDNSKIDNKTNNSNKEKASNSADNHLKIKNQIIKKKLIKDDNLDNSVLKTNSCLHNSTDTIISKSNHSKMNIFNNKSNSTLIDSSIIQEASNNKSDIELNLIKSKLKEFNIPTKLGKISIDNSLDEAEDLLSKLGNNKSDNILLSNKTLNSNLSDLSESSKISNLIQSSISSMLNVDNQPRFIQTNNKKDKSGATQNISNDVDIGSFHLSKDSIKYKVLKDFYLNHKSNVPSFIPFTNDGNDKSIKQIKVNPIKLSNDLNNSQIFIM